MTILYFAKEGDNCTFSPVYPEMDAARKIPFQKGVAQKFCQPSGSGIDLGFFDVDELSKPSQNEDVFPLVICAETNAPSPMDEQPNQPSSASSSHAQITLAVLEKIDEGNFRVRVVKQILWVEGVRYELREIYGISNAEDTAFEDTDPGKECVICMTEPKDTAVLPCRHMVRVLNFSIHTMNPFPLFQVPINSGANNCGNIFNRSIWTSNELRSRCHIKGFRLVA